MTADLSYIINIAERTEPDTASPDGAILAGRIRGEWARRNASGASRKQTWDPAHILTLLFDPPGPDWAQQIESLFSAWETDRHAHGPDLSDLVTIGLTRFGVDPESVYAQGAAIAAILGETENPMEFHNPVHHRKVLFHGLRLIEENNRLFANDPRAILAPEETALAMAAICIHDLMHDGKGNGHGKSYVPGRLEQQAFDRARPWLHAAGLDTEDLLDIESLILSTEVTPIGDPAAPAARMRSAYEFHFQGGLVCELTGKLTRLQGRRDLARIGMLIHVADIANSAGVSPAMSRHETALFMRECGIADSGTDPLPAFLTGVGAAIDQFEPARLLYEPSRKMILKTIEARKS